jgi:hypothetical protein
VGLTGFEPVTPALSAQCSNQLSYKPRGSQQLRSDRKLHFLRPAPKFTVWAIVEQLPHRECSSYSRKEVIQAHLPVHLPCYDFVPVTSTTFDVALLAVKLPASGVTSSHDVTGGVYKARERIQRTIADARLLATPSSCRRVAACNLN